MPAQPRIIPGGGIPWRFIRSWLSLAPRCRMGIPVGHLRNAKARDQLPWCRSCCFLRPISVPNQMVAHWGLEGFHSGTSSTRIYVRRHTPRKGIRLILDTVSRMRDRATQCDTSLLGGVTNAVSHVTASLFSQPPRSATSTHHNHRRLATRTHHLDRRLTTRAH